MEQVEHNYLFNCNLHRDIENNIGEVKIPEFSMEHIITIDEKYKKCFEKINKIVYQDISDEQQLIQMTNKFELNELFTEHRHNIEVLIIRMNEYNTIHSRFTSKNKITIEEKVNESMFIRSKQFQMYFEDILPIIQLDKENLNSVMVLVEDVISATI
jgi:hypothetical protein